MAELAARAGARLLLVSTDLVFDGTRGWYREEDGPSPLSVYGRTKVAAERVVLAATAGGGGARQPALRAERCRPPVFFR